MATWAILAAAGLYLLTAVDLYLKGKLGLSLTFFAYFVGNLGLAWAART